MSCLEDRVALNLLLRIRSKNKEKQCKGKDCVACCVYIRTYSCIRATIWGKDTWD